MENLTGRSRRLQFEYEAIMKRFSNRKDITVSVIGRNSQQIPNRYIVEYNIRSFCGIANPEQLGMEGAVNEPLYAERFLMEIVIPSNYPDVDAKPAFRFLTEENGREIPHPWHPNIRFYGEMAGRVCLNATDTFLGIDWGIARVAQYLKYERYHAVNEPPYPEDQRVAAWVIRQAEPNGWISF